MRAALLAALLLGCKDGLPADSAAPVVADAGPDRLVELGQPLTLDGSASAGAHFTWDFGDGEQAEGAVVTHTWAAPGFYTAVLLVTGADGSRRSDSARVSVHLPIHPVRPERSGTLAQDPATGALWVVTPEADTLARVSLEGASTRFPTCEEPVAVAADGEGVAVVCAAAAALELRDPEGTLLSTVALPAASRPQAVVGRDGVWWVSLPALGQLARVEGGALTLEDIGEDPRALALASDGTLWVSRWRATPEGGWLYRRGGEPLLLPLDTRPDSDTTTGGVPNLLEQLLPSPDGGRLYVPASQHNVLRGSFLSGQALSHETAMRAVLQTVEGADTPSPAAELAERKQLDDQGRALAVATSAEGNTVWVLSPGTGTATALNAWTGDVIGAVQGVGVGARALLLVGDTLLVHAWLDRELRAYDVSSLGQGAPLLWAAPLVEEEPLDAQLLLGKRLFWDAQDPRITRDAYIACAHCHPDGRDDGQTWDFTDRGEGLRNTTSLEGRAGTGMGRVHWTGNFDELQDFENDIRLHFAGLGLLDDADWAECQDPLGTPKAGRSADLDALAAYVTSLDQTPPSPWPAPEGGADLFAAAGCAACHPAPLYTDSTLADPLRHDVGTAGAGSGGRLGGPLDGFDTPTLLGAWDTAPYLHDGSAPTLEAAIGAHAPTLSADELALLAAYVRSL